MFGKWCEATYCDGVKEWYDSKTKPASFVFWTVIMIASIAASIWFTYTTIITYIESPRVTNIEIVPQKTVDIPDILVCYKGGLNVSAFQKYNLTDQFIRAFQSSLDYKPQQWNVSEVNDELQNALQTNKIGLLNFTVNMGYNCEDVVQFVIAGTSQLLPCNQSERWFAGGNCYAFKTELRQWLPDVGSGYVLQLKEPTNSFVQHFQNQTGMTSEFEISVAHSLNKPVKRIPVPVGSKVQITLNAKHYIRLKDDDQCSDDSGSCRYDCIVSVINNTFNCTPLSILNAAIEDIKSTTMCNPYFPDAVQIIEQVKAFTLDMAISNVGGQAGLWLGLSAVTIVQAFYYFVLGIYEKCTTTKIQLLKK